MPCPPLTLRADKGSALTAEEFDGNFTTLSDFVDSQEAFMLIALAADGTIKNPGFYYAEDTDAGDDDYVVTLAPAPTAIANLIGKLIILRVTTGNTGSGATINCNAFGAVVIRKYGTTLIESGDIPAGGIVVLCYDGTVFQLLQPRVPSQMVFYCTSGDTDTYTATITPAPPSLSSLIGKLILLKVTGANTVTGPTFNPNGLGATTITKKGAAALIAGDIGANAIIGLVYDGTQFQLQGF